MTKRTTLMILFSFLIIGLLAAQPSYTLKGTVNDENGDPLPLVHIFLTASKRGTVTNNDGEFALKFSGNEDVLTVSYIGYETQSIKVDRNTELLKIQLKPSILQLNEVVVNSLSAAGLLKRAIEKIPENYPLEPFLLQSYYRAKATEKDTLLYMEETVFNIVKSYRSSFVDEYFLSKNRNFRFSSESTRWKGVGAADVVKMASDFFDAGFFRNFDVRYLPGNTFDNRSVYVLEFSRKDKESGSRGKIYIDVEDLAFIRFELYLKGGNERLAQYKKIEDKYYFMSGNTVYINRIAGRVKPAETNTVTTAIIHSFSKDDIEGTRIDPEDILEVYATQEQDTLFWQQHSAILPDSTILTALEKYAEIQRDSIRLRNSLEYKAYIKRLYTPNLSLIASSDLLNDFSVFHHNSNSVNQYVSYLLEHNFHNPFAKLLSIFAYNYVMSPPFEDAASEWLLLNKNGIQAKMNPTLFNRYSDSYLYNIGDEALSDFKADNHLDFMRLHTVRGEGRYVKSFLMEEELAKVDLSNKNNKYNWAILYAMRLFWNRGMSLSDPFEKDVKQSNKPEEKQPILINRNRSWVKYLFSPETEYQRHIKKADLSDEEQKYFKHSSYWSWLNVVSPQMFGIAKFPIGNKNSFTFSLNYLRVPFGEMFGQNIWLMHNHSQLHGVFIKQYRNYDKTTFGIGYKLYDVALFRNMHVTSSVDFWQQPVNFDFKVTASFNGFHAEQTFEYQFLQSKYSKQYKGSFIFGYDYKSKGYMPESFFTEKNLNVKAGFKWYF